MPLAAQLPRITVERRVERRLRPQVERARAVIEQQDLGLADECARERNALALAARQARAALRHFCTIALRLPLDEVRRLRDLCRPAYLLIGGHIHTPSDVLADRHREELRLLQDDGHLPAQSVQRIRADIAAIDEDLARRRIVEARQQREQCALARARRADNGQRLPTRHLEGDIRQHIFLLTRIAEGDMVQGNGRWPSP